MKNIIIIAILLGISTSSIAQGVVSSQTLVYEKKILPPKEKFVSYRGYIDFAGELGSASGFSANIVPLGLQFNPYLFIGLGAGITSCGANLDKYTSEYMQNNLPFNTFLRGKEQRNIVRTYSFSKPVLNGLSFSPFLVVRVNFLKDKPFIPYASVAGGYMLSEKGAAYFHARLGISKYFAAKRTSLSAFIGVASNASTVTYEGIETVNYQYRNLYSYLPPSSWYNETSYSHNRKTDPISSLTFSLGLSFEFGGSAGFKTRPKKQ